MAWDDEVTTLTDFTETSEFKDAVSEFTKPVIGVEPVTATPPRDYQGLEYALIGMAIDYLLRFEVQRRNPNADIHTGELIAENAMHPRYADASEHDIAGVLAGAKASCTAYVNGDDEVPTQEVLDLARLENLVRGGPQLLDSIDKYLGEGDEDLEQDLLNLLELADPILDVEEYAVLNPVLAERGVVADADMILDGALIDLKTTINPEFTSKFWRQLLGYLVLLDIQSERGTVTRGWEVTCPDEFGVYFARSGDLKMLSTEPVYTHEEYDEVKELMLEALHSGTR